VSRRRKIDSSNESRPPQLELRRYTQLTNGFSESLIIRSQRVGRVNGTLQIIGSREFRCTTSPARLS
jgi:hypothetical protein